MDGERENMGDMGGCGGDMCVFVHAVVWSGLVWYISYASVQLRELSEGKAEEGKGCIRIRSCVSMDSIVHNIGLELYISNSKERGYCNYGQIYHHINRYSIE